MEKLCYFLLEAHETLQNEKLQIFLSKFDK